MSLQGLMGHLSPGAAQSVPRPRAQGEGTQEGGALDFGESFTSSSSFSGAPVCTRHCARHGEATARFLLSWKPSCGEIHTGKQMH